MRRKMPFCMHCKKVFCTKYKLDRHIETHDDNFVNKNLTCECKKKFSSISNLNKHRRAACFVYMAKAISAADISGTMVSTLLPKRKIHFCEHCNKLFRTKYKLERHMDTHDEEYVYQNLTCECGTKFCSIGNRNKHQRKSCPIYKQQEEATPAISNDEPEEPVAETIIPKRKVHFCEPCNKTFRTKYKLERHMDTHDDDFVNKNLTCACGTKFSSIGNLNKHLRNSCQINKEQITPTTPEVLATVELRPVPKRKNHFCESCNKLFRTKYKLDRHMDTHDDDFVIKHLTCDCGIKFSSIGNLNKHQRRSCQMHKNESTSTKKQHFCETCGNYFRTKYILDRHMETHDEDFVYHHLTCECGKIFSIVGNLNKHQRNSCPIYKQTTGKSTNTISAMDTSATNYIETETEAEMEDEDENNVSTVLESYISIERL